ncbi:MAG TPA: alpha/beta hydrolase-fold protein [Longimicrobium sp.]|nr:alpha/beta hydrolase-fold protein [Longimicrobium sp.]
MMIPMMRKLAAPWLFAVLAGVWVSASAAAQEQVPPHETFTIESTALGETRRINVYTPPGYTQWGAEYPVLYMPDGGVQEDFPHVAATVDAGIRASEMRRMIVVGIENTERRRDMTGPTEVAEDRAIAPRVGGSAAFRRFIADELMPEVRRRYRVTGETAIIGESLAGLFIVETFFLQPGLFHTYIALSPSLWWNNEALVRGSDARLKDAWWDGLSAPRVLYLSSADEDNIAPAAARLAEVLRANEVFLLQWQYQPRPELTHATIYRAEAPRVLRELFSPAPSIMSVTSPPERIDRNDTTNVTPLRGGSAVSREPVGAFTLIREEYTNPRPAPHTTRGWKKIHLSFHTPDRRVNVALTDNGAGLSASASSPGCWVGVRYLQYGYDGDESHLFRALREGLGVLLEKCGSSMEDPAAYQRQLQAAEADFPDAVRAMRARVTELFGARTERCNPPEPSVVPRAGLHNPNPCGS